MASIDPAGTSVVAILDTGVDAGHPDLDGVVVPGASFVDGSTWSNDPNGHGTAMAGIVAAETGNGLGVAGVGYDGVSVMPVTVLGADGTGQDSDVIEGLVWAADHGADVALMAFSSYYYSSALQAAVDYAWSKGVVLVAAVGNDSQSVPAFPAGDRGVIGVSSTDERDALAGFSNFGEAVFLAAPGRRDPDHVRGWRLLRDLGDVRSSSARRGGGGAARCGRFCGVERRHRRPARAERRCCRARRRRRAMGASTWLGPCADASTESVQPAGTEPGRRRSLPRTLCRG